MDTKSGHDKSADQNQQYAGDKTYAKPKLVRLFTETEPTKGSRVDIKEFITI